MTGAAICRIGPRYGEKPVKSVPSAGAWEIIAEFTLDTTAISFCTVRYTVFEDGMVAVEETLAPGSSPSCRP